MLSPISALATIPPPALLTAREREIVDLIVETAAPNKVIAFQLGIAVPTLKGRLTTIYLKLGVESRTELVLYVLRGGAL
jgi:DNA-binding NarL/FixJ family response regulator